MAEKEQLQSCASQQAQDFAEQLRQVQEQSMSEQERAHMKEQIINFQQRLSEKETKYIKLDNELRTKKKEMEKLQKRLDEGADGELPQQKQNAALPGNMLVRVSNHNPQTIEFDELMNTSIDAITQRIKMKNSKSKDRSPSVPKLNFRNMKEFQEQDWLSYAHRLEESIQTLNQRIGMQEEQCDLMTQKYH